MSRPECEPREETLQELNRLEIDNRVIDNRVIENRVIENRVIENRVIEKRCHSEGASCAPEESMHFLLLLTKFAIMWVSRPRLT